MRTRRPPPTTPSRAACPSRAEPRGRRALAALALLALLGCPSKPAADAHYRTRGLVQAQEGAGDDMRLAIHHEAIPTFRDREGREAPMGSMTMAFGLAPALEKVVLAPGTKVAIAFEVRWRERPPLVITELTRLPESTELVLTDDHH